MPKKSKQVIGALPKMSTTEITYPMGAASVENEAHAIEVLTAYVETKAQIDPIIKTLEIMRKVATDWMKRTKTPTVQLEESYFRLVQRHTRKWVTRKSEMPKPKPKGVKSLEEICKGRVTDAGKPLFNAVTTRVADPAKIDVAINKGWITEDEIMAAYIEFPNEAYVQQYQGEAKD